MKIKEESTENERKYVEAYVEYIHTLEAIHNILEHSNVQHVGHQNNCLKDNIPDLRCSGFFLIKKENQQNETFVAILK